MVDSMSGSAILIEMDEIGSDDIQQLSLWIKDSKKIFLNSNFYVPVVEYDQVDNWYQATCYFHEDEHMLKTPAMQVPLVETNYRNVEDGSPDTHDTHVICVIKVWP